MTDELDLDAIEARAEAATDGPWNFAYAPNPEAGDETKAEYLANTCDPNSPEPLWVCWTPDPEGGSDDYVIPALTGDGPTSRSNVEFIAHARDDVPALVDAVRTLTTENERQAGEIERLYSELHGGEGSTGGLEGWIGEAMTAATDRDHYAAENERLRGKVERVEALAERDRTEACVKDCGWCGNECDAKGLIAYVPAAQIRAALADSKED